MFIRSNTKGGGRYVHKRDTNESLIHMILFYHYLRFFLGKKNWAEKSDMFTYKLSSVYKNDLRILL